MRVLLARPGTRPRRGGLRVGVARSPVTQRAHGACAWDWPVGSLAQDGTRSDEMNRPRELRNAQNADYECLLVEQGFAIPAAHNALFSLSHKPEAVSNREIESSA